MNKGRIVQVMGPVVDVVFEDGNLPFIKDALEVVNNGKTCIMEVAQHLGNNEVRCLMLAASEGLHKDMEVTATGEGIKVPVGEQTLGRLFNVLGETIDDGAQIESDQKWVIHRDPPSFEDQSPVIEILETGIKVIDLLAPYAKGGKIGLFGGAGVGKTVLIQELSYHKEHRQSAPCGYRRESYNSPPGYTFPVLLLDRESKPRVSRSPKVHAVSALTPAVCHISGKR